MVGSAHPTRLNEDINMNNSSISANTLFHFTETIDNLEGILRSEFEPNYSLENMDPILGDDFKIGIPMVSFCDIPLSQIHNHVGAYGCYALGLSKDWGKRNKINPVLYTYKGSAIANHIKSLLDQIQESLLNDPFASARDFVNFIKPYEGELLRKDKDAKQIRFYDEREWRYVPSIGDGDEIARYLLEEDFLKTDINERKTRRLHRKKLSFTPNDIKYIIVNNESEILDLVRKLKIIKMKFSDDEKEKLITRIITMDQIKEDF